MHDFVLVMTGVLAANLLTVLFLWGAWHMFKRHEHELQMPHFAAVIGPCALIGLGAWLYG